MATALTYSIEESALIGGLIAEYFSRASVSDSVRLAYRQVYQHLMDGHLTQDDLGQIQAALDFLLPVFPTEREAQKTFRAAILKTKAMLKGKNIRPEIALPLICSNLEYKSIAAENTSEK